MKKEEKIRVVEELKDYFSRFDSFYLVDFMKMPVSKFNELRRQLKEKNFSLKVIKNRLALRALREDFPEEIKQFFLGPTAIAFSPENPLVLARILRDFSLKNNLLKVKGGMIGGHIFRGEEFEEVASLSSREEMLAKLGSLIAIPLIKLLKTWQAPLNNLGLMLSQLNKKHRVEV